MVKIQKSYVIPFSIDKKGQVNVLMGVIKEKPNHRDDKQPYTYSFLGGTCEKGESAKQCLIREFLEETSGVYCLSKEQLSSQKSLSFVYHAPEGAIKIYIIKLPDLDDVIHKANYDVGNNHTFPPEFLEYHFLQSVPMIQLLKLSRIHPSSYVPGKIPKTKKWKVNADEFNRLTKGNKKVGIWSLSKDILQHMLELIISDDQ